MQDFIDQVPLSAVYNHDMLNEMMLQRPTPRTTTSAPRPLPDSSFITAARDALGTGRASTSTAVGDLAMKAASMRIARREVEKARKEAERTKKRAEAVAKK